MTHVTLAIEMSDEGLERAIHCLTGLRSLIHPGTDTPTETGLDNLKDEDYVPRWRREPEEALQVGDEVILEDNPFDYVPGPGGKLIDRVYRIDSFCGLGNSVAKVSSERVPSFPVSRARLKKAHSSGTASTDKGPPIDHEMLRSPECRVEVVEGFTVGDRVTLKKWLTDGQHPASPPSSEVAGYSDEGSILLSSKLDGRMEYLPSDLWRL